MKVSVYYNLHKKCLSVKSHAKNSYGKVIAHVNEIYLKDVQFIVSQAGRNRVLTEKRKNVHAYVRGHTTEQFSIQKAIQVKYNPYKNQSFVDENGSPIYSARHVIIKDKKIFVSSS